MNKTFSYNGTNYLIDKLTSYSDVDIRCRDSDMSTFYYVVFYFTLNFSGDICEISKRFYIDKYEDRKSWKDFFIKKETERYNLVKNIHYQYAEYVVKCDENHDKRETFLNWAAKRLDLTDELNNFIKYREEIINEIKNK